MAEPNWFSFVSLQRVDLPRGNNPAYWLSHLSYAKIADFSADSPSPYLIPNEWISQNIASFLRLRNPPFALVRKGPHTERMFASLEFTKGPLGPADADPNRCWEIDKSLCTGIVLFDVLIGNNDRRDANLLVDDPESPKEIVLIDCDQGVFGSEFRKPTNFLALQDEFLADPHFLLNVMDSGEFVESWVNRIRTIPPWFFESICLEVVGPGITKRQAKAAAKFLQYRAANLPMIIWSNRKKFRRVESWPRLM